MMTKVMSHFNSRLTTAMFLSIRERLINQKDFPCYRSRTGTFYDETSFYLNSNA